MTKHPRSLAYRTDLMFARFDGVVSRRDHHWTIHSPNNPRYHWGNFLLFDRPPTSQDASQWLALFDQEIAQVQPTEHIALGWDVVENERGALEGFLERGMQLSMEPVLVAQELTMPSHANMDVEVRALRTQHEWDTATALQIQQREPCHTLESYTQFKSAQMARYRAMSEAGLGHWFGAFVQDQLVADLGLFHDGAGTARYQAVHTAASHRRQGICTRLVIQSAQMLSALAPIEHLVIVAESSGVAQRVYERAGFEQREVQLSLGWFEGMPPQEDVLDGV